MKEDKYKNKISVVMPVYNTRPEWLRAAVESILNQTFEDFEFVIVLDAPTDDSAKLIEEYAAKDKRIKVKKNETNKGITWSLNRGISESSSGIIARMDSDDIAIKDRLQKQYEYLESNRMDLVGARIMIIDEAGIATGNATAIIDDNKIYRILKYANCVAHPTWMMRRELYDDLGGYRDAFACEDYDFLVRAAERKAAIGICDEVLLMLRSNTTSITHTNYFPQYLMTRYIQRTKGRATDDDIARANEIYINKSTANERDKFIKAVALAGQGMREIKSKKTWRGIHNLIKASITSKYAPAYVRNQLMIDRLNNEK